MTSDVTVQTTNFHQNITRTTMLPDSADSYILLIEDDPILGKVLSQAFAKRGIKLKVVVEGQTAVRMLDQESRPSLVILDIVLPIYNGFEILNLIRSTPGWKDIPVIVMSSKSEEADIATAFDRGANDYLQKPVSIKELFDRICCYSEKVLEVS